MDEELLCMTVTPVAMIAVQLALLAWAYRCGRRDEAIRQRWLRAAEQVGQRVARDGIAAD